MRLNQFALCLAEYPADEAAWGLAFLVCAAITLLMIRHGRQIPRCLISTDVADFLCVILLWNYMKRHHIERFLHLEFEVLRALKVGGVGPVKVRSIEVEGLDQVVVGVR